jgi:ribosomal protein S18 acetylase RimI-like enzyme
LSIRFSQSGYRKRFDERTNGLGEADIASKKDELLVHASNERAIRLYSKFGFLEEGRFKDRIRLPDGSFRDDLAMAWFPER